jgi:hypothetical protein
VVDVVRRLVEHRLPKLVVAVLQDTRRRPIRFVPVPVRKRQGCQLTCAVAWPRRDHHAGGRAAVADLAAADPGRSPGQARACRSWIYPRAPGFGPGGRARARPTSPATGSAPGPGPQRACWRGHDVRLRLTDGQRAVLGRRAHLIRLTKTGIAWNPRDEDCVACVLEIVEGERPSMRGTVYSVAPVDSA